MKQKRATRKPGQCFMDVNKPTCDNVHFEGKSQNQPCPLVLHTPMYLAAWLHCGGGTEGQEPGRREGGKQDS